MFVKPFQCQRDVRVEHWIVRESLFEQSPHFIKAHTMNLSGPLILSMLLNPRNPPQSTALRLRNPPQIPCVIKISLFQISCVIVAHTHKVVGNCLCDCALFTPSHLQQLHQHMDCILIKALLYIAKRNLLVRVHFCFLAVLRCFGNWNNARVNRDRVTPFATND